MDEYRLHSKETLIAKVQNTFALQIPPEYHKAIERAYLIGLQDSATLLNLQTTAVIESAISAQRQQT